MRRLSFVILLALAALALPAGALGEAWGPEREIRCAEDRPGCRLLQMVMTGSFDARDPEDAVLERVLAAAWPRLREVTEADIAHFAEEFGEDAEDARLRWYGALANCLRADIAQEALPEDQLDAARRVLMLFLDPPEAPEAEAQRAAIRREMTDAVLGRLADAVDAPPEFIRWAIG